MPAQGTPLQVVSELLGHASIAITKDVYGHLLEGDKRAAAESTCGPSVVERQLGKRAGGALLGSYPGPAVRAGPGWSS